MCYVHLHNHSVYSLLDGCITPETLFPRLTDLGMSAFALTDHGSMSAIPAFVSAADDKFKIIAGCEMYEVDDISYKTAEEAANTEGMSCEVDVSKSQARQENVEIYGKKNPRYWHITLLAKNYDGYHKLTRLTAAAATPDAFYFKPRIDYSMLETIAKGNDVLCGLGCALSRLSQYCLNFDDYQGWSDRVDRYLKVFGDENVYCEIMANSYDGQKIINEKSVEWAAKKGIPIVPTLDAHYATREAARIQDILLCVATNQKVTDETRKFKFEGDCYYIRSEQEIIDAFKMSYDIDVRSYMPNAGLFAEQCEHAGYINDKVFRLPRYNIPRDAGWERFKDWVRGKEALKRERYGELVDQLLKGELD